MKCVRVGTIKSTAEGEASVHVCVPRRGRGAGSSLSSDAEV